MSKKDRMLDYITNNIYGFMTSTVSLQVIPYNELSVSTFNRVKQYFANDAEYSDVVCLISTSVWETGKTGILFTTDYVYSKAWGLFQGIYKNSIYSSSSAQFDYVNDFDIDRMRMIMSGLANIARDEDNKKNTLNTIEGVGKAILGGFALLDIIASMGDSAVDINNEAIANNITDVNDNDDGQTKNIMSFYGEFISPINEFIEMINDIEYGEDIDDDTRTCILEKLNDILLKLYYQTDSQVDVPLDDVDEYTKFSEWVTFWAYMFYDADQFRENYPLDALQAMPECWDAIATMVDALYEENDDDEIFSDALVDFADTIIDNTNKMFELMSNSSWDEDFDETMLELSQSNINAVRELEDVLDNVTDYIPELL